MKYNCVSVFIITYLLIKTSIISHRIGKIWRVCEYQKVSQRSEIQNCKYTQKLKKHFKRCQNVSKGERKWTVQNELSNFGSGIRTCILRMQNLGVRNASHCSAKGFFESFLQRKKQAPFGTCFFFGSGIRIRTLNDGVRVRSVTVTLYRYLLC